MIESLFVQELWEAIGLEDLDIPRLKRALRKLEAEGWTILRT